MKNTRLSYLFVIITFVTFANTVLAQSDKTKTEQETTSYSSLLNGVKQDDNVKQMLNAYVKNSKNDETSGFYGYAIQIASLSGANAKNEAIVLRSDFLQAYPDISVYMKYKSPNFIVLAGDCRNKSEALRIKNIIKESYPNAFIIQDMIQYPKLFTE